MKIKIFFLDTYKKRASNETQIRGYPINYIDFHNITNIYRITHLDSF